MIKDTTIEFTIGRRYGLIGSNGSGKSSFLKCLADREVPIPDHIDIFFLEEEYRKSDMNAIEAVVHVVEDEIKRLEAESERVLEEDGPECELLQDIYARLDAMDPSTFESRAAALLTGLGFEPDMMMKKTADLSGGWRMRGKKNREKRANERARSACMCARTVALLTVFLLAALSSVFV